jgi:RNA polymerase sigma factor (sigma-70 family)
MLPITTWHADADVPTPSNSMSTTINHPTKPERRTGIPDILSRQNPIEGVREFRSRSPDRRVAKLQLYLCLRKRMKCARAALLAQHPREVVQAAIEIAWDKGIDAIVEGLAERMSPPARRQWLRVVIQHTLFTLLRRKRLSELRESEALPAKSHSWIEEQDRARMIEAMKMLRPQDRDLINALYFEGMTRQEAAEHLKVPLTTIRKRREAALGRLRDAFRGLEK